MKLGSAFSDALETGHNSFWRKRDSDNPWWVGSGRALLFATVLFFCFFVLIWRLVDLTLVHGFEYRRMSDNNRVRSIVRHAPRGNLLDRTGKPVTQNSPQYRLITPCQEDANDCVRYLSEEEGKRLEMQGFTNGQFLELDYLRQYPYGEALAHLVGYTGELSEEELTAPFFSVRNYIAGDRVGRMGAEEVYNERLRGVDGKQLVEVDAAGKILRELGRQEAVPGEDITLAVDSGLAQVAMEAFPRGIRGAILVAKPSTGEILALYSSPGFSPDAFSKGMSQSSYTALLEDPALPMFNRAIGGVYPPGSTYKIITSVAGLESGALTKSTRVEDTGVITIGQFSFANWYFTQYGRKDGNVDIVKALARSNDIFFYRAGEWIGIDTLVEWSKKFGIGKPLGIELSGEASGLVPDPQWKKNHFSSPQDKEARNDQWYLGDTYHIGIGQGYLLTTPLQVNAWTNVIANGGKVCRPTIEKQKSVECRDLALQKETIDLVLRGMEEACSTGGTAFPFFDFGVTKDASPSGEKIAIPIACKTGTAEFGDPENNTHAWFTAFGPLPEHYIPQSVKNTQEYVSGEPEISVTVLVEAAGEGSSVAAPIAKKIFEAWFER